MINQQVLDYIRQQLAAGVVKENIKTALKSQGWSEQDVTEGFLANEKLVVVSTPQTVNSLSSIWAKGIPRTNKVFMVIYLLLVFGLDLFIAISSPDLLSFWYMMLGVFALFAVFFYLENFIFSKEFTNTTSGLDKGISLIIVLRNLLFLLNFIPLIQLLGLAGLMYVGWIIGLIYLGLIIARFNQIKNKEA